MTLLAYHPSLEVAPTGAGSQRAVLQNAARGYQRKLEERGFTFSANGKPLVESVAAEDPSHGD